MHILFLTDNFPPEVNAPASRTFEHAREWVKAGHQVTVITCAPNFPKGKVYAGYRNRLWQSEEMSGIRVIRVWSYITANHGFSRRIADYVSYMCTATIAALFVRRVDIVVATSPQFFTAVAGWMVGGLKRKPWVFELRDLWPESIRAVGAMRESRLLDWIERLELFLYRRARAVVSVTEAFRRNLIGRGISPDKIRVVTNGVDLSRYARLPKDAELLDQLGLGATFVAGYVGTMGMAHALDTVLDAAALLKDSPEGGNVRLLIVGDGAEKAALRARADAERLDNVIFVDSVSKELVPRYWSLLDVSIIHLRRSELFETVIPSKLFECMAMELPVVFGVKGEAAAIVEAHQVGLLIEPQDAQAMAAAILRLRDDTALRQRLAANGPRAAQHFDRRNLAANMLQALKETAGRGG